MPADEFYAPDDPGALRMENELLALENRFLKGRLSANEERLERLEAAAVKKRGSAAPASAATVTVPAAQYRRLEMADRDVRTLMGKLNRRPYRWLLRGRLGFKRFVSRYAVSGENGDRS